MFEEPVSKFTNHKLVVVEKNVTVTDTVKVMVESKIDSILVSENDDVVGIVTNKDILSDVIAKGKNPNDVKIFEIAHKPIIKIHKDAPVKDAIALMNKHDVRRLVVENDVRAIGTITRKQIVGNLNQYATELPELEAPSKYMCPYCYSVFAGKRALSSHTDDIHIGRGLLEGNITKATI